ncbi:MAG: proline racemase family protein [Phycisphaerae bacterium]|nr:proline racemase family protein [Phycisphaerae bacterium]
MIRARVIDSHTEGEPTRVVVQGAPELPGATVAEKARALAGPFDWFRRAVVCEPRGSDILVGALLVQPDAPAAAAGVIFFNNAGVLGMCGHGTMGVVRTLAHMTRLPPGTIRLDTPVGQVQAENAANGTVAVQNVRSFAERLDLAVPLPDGRTVHGDLAWGGNWFFLCADHGVPVDTDHLAELDRAAWQIRRALEAAGVTTSNGRPIDHIELLAPPRLAANDGRNFVLCPGGAYDRSPCGTGTSAKIACLAARGELAPGERWRQESVIGSVFEAWYEPCEQGGVLPTVAGRAWITGETDLLFDPTDPYRNGL